MDELIKIRDVSLKYGVSNRALVYYEETGLLKSVRGEGYAYRMYDSAAIRKLEQILILRRLGIGLKDIALIFSAKDSDMLLDALSRKVASIDDEIAAMNQLKMIIKDFMKQVRGLDFLGGDIKTLYEQISGVEARTPVASHNEGLYPVRDFAGGRYIDGIPQLRWGQSRDCTWAGAVKLLLDAIGVNATYAEIMGFSGACYFFSMTGDWSPAACMPQIAYDPGIALDRALGVERVILSPDDLDAQITGAIDRGMPAMLIQPRVEMEWGVICGYTEGGRFFGRSYFDYLRPDEKDVFTKNDYFLADSYPGVNPNMVYCYRKRTAPFPLDEALKTSLEIARDIYFAKPKHNGYFTFGEAAYDILIDGLRRDDAGFAALSPYGSTGNGLIILTRLIDARRAAHAFWMDKAQYLPAENAEKMRDAANLYAGIVSALSEVLPSDTVSSTQNGFPFEAWPESARKRFADALSTCKTLEKQAMDVISGVLDEWK